MLLRILDKLQLEMKTLLRLRNVAIGRRSRQQRADRNHRQHLIATRRLVVGPGCRPIRRGTAAGGSPAADGEGAARVGEAVAPEIDVVARQVRVLFLARTGGLSNVVHPHVAGVSLGRSSQPIRNEASD